MDYDELRRVYRLEKNTSKLVQVDKDFFSQLKNFVEDERKNYLSSLQSGAFSKAKDFTNLKKLVEEVFSLREKKLLNSALISSRTDEEPDVTLSAEEAKTFEKLLNVLQEHKKIYSQLFSEKQKKEKTKKEPSKVSVKTVKEIPSFIGVDMKEYGPFEKNKKVSLPAKTAELLVARKLAEKI